MGSGGAGRRAGGGKASPGGGGGGAAVETRPTVEPPGEARSLSEAEGQLVALGIGSVSLAYLPLDVANVVVVALKELKRFGFAMPNKIDTTVGPSSAVASMSGGGRLRLHSGAGTLASLDALRRDMTKGFASTFVSTASIYHVVRHELGHHLHNLKVGLNTFYGGIKTNRFRDLAPSRYGRTNDLEFVAESFSKIMNRQKLTRDQYRAYKALGGYLPSDRRRKFQ